MRCRFVSDKILQKSGKRQYPCLLTRKDQFVMDVEIASHRKVKNTVLSSLRVCTTSMPSKFRDFSLKVAEEDLSDLEEGRYTTAKSSDLKFMKMMFFLVQLNSSARANDVWWSSVR